MPQQTSKKDKIGFGVAIFFIGAGVGWLAGLAVSPVVGIIITSVTGSAAAIIAVLAGIDTSERRTSSADKDSDDVNAEKKGVLLLSQGPKVSPFPLLLFVLGIVGGSALGILARNNSVLGSGPSIAVDEWVRAGLVEPDWPREKIVERLFESATLTNTTIDSLPASLGWGSVLFFQSSAISECKVLLAAAKTADDDFLRGQLESLKDERIAALSSVITSSRDLRNFVEQVLCAEP